LPRLGFRPQRSVFCPCCLAGEDCFFRSYLATRSINISVRQLYKSDSAFFLHWFHFRLRCEQLRFNPSRGRAFLTLAGAVGVHGRVSLNMHCGVISAPKGARSGSPDARSHFPPISKHRSNFGSLTTEIPLEFIFGSTFAF
jgi:hypothetical protein